MPRDPLRRLPCPLIHHQEGYARTRMGATERGVMHNTLNESDEPVWHTAPKIDGISAGGVRRSCRTRSGETNTRKCFSRKEEVHMDAGQILTLVYLSSAIIVATLMIVRGLRQERDIAARSTTKRQVPNAD